MHSLTPGWCHELFTFREGGGSKFLVYGCNIEDCRSQTAKYSKQWIDKNVSFFFSSFSTCFLKPLSVSSCQHLIVLHYILFSITLLCHVWNFVSTTPIALVLFVHQVLYARLTEPCHHHVAHITRQDAVLLLLLLLPLVPFGSCEHRLHATFPSKRHVSNIGKDE